MCGEHKIPSLFGFNTEIAFVNTDRKTPPITSTFQPTLNTCVYKVFNITDYRMLNLNSSCVEMKIIQAVLLE